MSELMELSKLNFNNTQFDSGDPITVQAARRVGDILKNVPAGKPVSGQAYVEMTGYAEKFNSAI